MFFSQVPLSTFLECTLHSIEITGLTQRVLNNLERTMLSRHCMILLLPHLLLSPSALSKLHRRHTERLRKRYNLLTGE
jgi:hypothetical protein